MERDRELFSLLRKERPNIVRVYRMDRRGVTVGRTHRDRIPEDWQVNPANIAVRPTGGGAVLHEDDLCFSLIFPWSLSLSRSRNWPSFYESIHQVLAEFLRAAGIDPELLRVCPKKSDRIEKEGMRRGLCFYDPVRGDLMLGYRKILGGALAIGRNGVLYQGSLAVPDKDPAILSSFFEKWYRAHGRAALENALSEECLSMAGRERACRKAVDTS
jgi:lipoate-protein ligase A